MYKGVGVRFANFISFHFHRVFKNGGGRRVQANPMNPILGPSHVGLKEYH